MAELFGGMGKVRTLAFLPLDLMSWWRVAESRECCGRFMASALSMWGGISSLELTKISSESEVVRSFPPACCCSVEEDELSLLSTEPAEPFFCPFSPMAGCPAGRAVGPLETRQLSSSCCFRTDSSRCRIFSFRLLISSL